MNNDALGHVLALTIWAGRDQSDPDIGGRVYEALSTMHDSWTDERKADLYSLLAERLEPTMTFEQFRRVTCACLLFNEQWASRHG